MSEPSVLSRRAFLASAAALPLAAAVGGRIPIGLEMYSVRDDLKKDLPGTVSAVAKMGYQCVEFYAPYFDWSPGRSQTVRKQMDDLGIRCNSTHNGLKSFSAEGIGNAIDLNQILGSRYVVLAHPGNVKTLDDWKQIAEKLNTADAKLQAAGLHAGYHNHDLEWKPVDGQKPLELLAANTAKTVMLQLDVGTCVETGNDPLPGSTATPDASAVCI